MATTARTAQPPASNGVIVAPPKGSTGVNRKKQKRRAKQAAKAATQTNGALSPVIPDGDYEEDPLGYAEEDEYELSESEQHQYADSHSYPPSVNGVNGHDVPAVVGSKKNKKKKKKTIGGSAHDAYNPDVLGSRLPDLPHGAQGHINSMRQQSIWNTSTQQERQNIRNFWLGLSEDERKSLLKIEKEAVLRKLKQQQKHSCSCTICGRKRIAIEEELEVLYEAYYEELEQYAHHDHQALAGSDSMLPPPLVHPHAHTSRSITAPPPHLQSNHRTSQMLEHLEEDGEYSEDEAEYSEDEDYSDEDIEPSRGPVPDFFNFGQNLTVKGMIVSSSELCLFTDNITDNLLTVADDLLKNDGRRFIEMMEQLAERRMQRETEAEYAAANPSHPGGYHPNDPGYVNDDPMGPGDEFDDEEASYDSQEEYDDDLEDDDETVSPHTDTIVAQLMADQNALTEEQRMQEGRRMFQIFAARMFEHRVLTAYKEKVAAERQQRLLEELQNEEQLEAQREAKKKRDAEKKKDKKKQQQAAKAEERAKKEAEKAADEARVREAEEKKQEEQRRKKEEQRRKKDEERRKLDEERLRKEADRLRKQQEEQSRREDAERKAREQKAADKARKEELRKREKEERDAREHSANERKAQDDKEKREREATTLRSAQDQPPQIAKRPSQNNMVAVPGVLTKQLAAASPKNASAAPSTSRTAPAPAKHRQSSQQGSHASSPHQAQSHTSSAPSKSTSPGSTTAVQTSSHAPKTILQKPSHLHQAQPFVPMPRQDISLPLGIPISQPQQQHQMQHGTSTMSPMGFPPYQGQSNHMLPGGMRSPMPMYSHNGPMNAGPGRMPSFHAGPLVDGMHGPPPGILTQGRGAGTQFDVHAANVNGPPGFGLTSAQQQMLPIGSNANNSIPHDIGRSAPVPHSRQQSVNEKSFDPAIGQPISRPAPIKRPSSIKGQQADHSDIDGLSKQLGSSALLGDGDDDPEPLARRSSQRTTAGGFAGSPGSFGAASSSWSTPFGQAAGLGQQWGALPQAGMPGWNNNTSGFGSIGPSATLGRPGLHVSNRPLTIRIAVCQACQRLSGGSNGVQDFHDIGSLIRQIEVMRPALDSPPTMTEIELICETEGDTQNGGGELDVQRAPNGTIAAVRWKSNAVAPDTARIGGMGEIGSPLPSKSTPAIFGAPGMGRVAPGPATSGWSGHGF